MKAEIKTKFGSSAFSFHSSALLLVEFFFFAACLLYAYHFAALRMGVHVWEPASFERMVAGTALTPFQYRVLIPWGVNALRSLPFFSGISLEQYRFGSEFLFTFLLLVTFRAYADCFLRHGIRSALAVFPLAWALPFHYLRPTLEQLGLYYVYDLPSVFFFTLGLLLLYRRRWRLFYPVFLLATFNRETTCFLTVIFFFTHFRLDGLPGWLRKYSVFRIQCSEGIRDHDERRAESANHRLNESTEHCRPNPEHSRPRFLAHCLAQLALWCLIKYGLSWAYGGTLHYVHYTRNFYLLRVPSTYPIMLSVFGYLWIPVLLRFRRIGDDFARRACYAIPLFFAGMFVVAQMYELRLYGEMIPVVVGAVVGMARRNYGERRAYGLQTLERRCGVMQRFLHEDGYVKSEDWLPPPLLLAVGFIPSRNPWSNRSIDRSLPSVALAKERP